MDAGRKIFGFFPFENVDSSHPSGRQTKTIACSFMYSNTVAGNQQNSSSQTYTSVEPPMEEKEDDDGDSDRTAVHDF
jgi:hypothetical protein